MDNRVPVIIPLALLSYLLSGASLSADQNQPVEARSLQKQIDELKEGQQILVKCIGKEGNKIKLSRKAILNEEKAKASGEGE